MANYWRAQAMMRYHNPSILLARSRILQDKYHAIPQYLRNCLFLALISATPHPRCKLFSSLRNNYCYHRPHNVIVIVATTVITITVTIVAAVS